MSMLKIFLMVLMISSLSILKIFSENTQGEIIEAGAGSFILKKNDGTEARYLTGIKITKFIPSNYRTLVGDTVSIVYNTVDKNGETRQVVSMVELIKTGDKQINSIFICRLIEVGRKWIKATMINKELPVRLVRSGRSSYIPEEWNPKKGDIVKVRIKQKGNRYGNLYDYFIISMEKIDEGMLTQTLTDVENEIAQQNNIKEQNESGEELTPEKLINMIRSNDYNSIRFAAKKIQRAPNLMTKEVITELQTVITTYIEQPSEDPIAVDSISWCCKVLQLSRDESCIDIMKKLRDAEVNSTIKSWAKKILKNFNVED